MRVAAYAGSFDPLTRGHLAILEPAAALFDKVYLVIAANAEKGDGRFPVAERLAMATDACKHLSNVEVINVYGAVLVHWAKEQGVGWMIRGLRGPSDINAERELAVINATLEPSIQTIWIPSPVSLETVSSSMVMSFLRPLRGWVEDVRPMVPPVVHRGLLGKFLRDYFIRICKQAKSDVSIDAVLEAFRDIQEAYTGPDRHYHTLEHIIEVLEHLDRVAPDTKSLDYLPLRFAAFYHDYVNGGGDGLDEEKSVDKANAAMYRKLGLPIPLCQRTFDFILATYKAGDNDQARLKESARLFVDADMAVLARQPERYDVYAKQIRKEYARFDDATYAAGRIHFLASTLAKERIFLTPAFASLEPRARENLKAEREDYSS